MGFSGRGDGEKWMDLKSMLGKNLFNYRLNVGVEGEESVKNDSQVSGLSSWMGRGVTYLDEGGRRRGIGKVGVGSEGRSELRSSILDMLNLRWE